VGKVNGKTRDFHSFLGFFAEIACFYWFFAAFTRIVRLIGREFRRSAKTRKCARRAAI
jgi:hypothetical protein